MMDQVGGMMDQVGWLKVSLLGAISSLQTNSEFTPDKLMVGRLLFYFGKAYNSSAMFVFGELIKDVKCLGQRLHFRKQKMKQVMTTMTYCGCFRNPAAPGMVLKPL